MYLFSTLFVFLIHAIQCTQVAEQPKFLKLNQIGLASYPSYLYITVSNSMIISLAQYANVYSWDANTYLQLPSIQVALVSCYVVKISFYTNIHAYGDCIVAIGVYRLAIMNLTNNKFLFVYQNFNDLFATVIESKITQNSIYALISNGKLIRFQRNSENQSYAYQNYNLPARIFNWFYTSYSTNKISVCEVSRDFQYIIIWTACNQIQLLSNKKGTYKVQHSWPATSSCGSNINNIQFNSDCSLIIIQKDNLQVITIFDVRSMNIFSTIAKPTQTVYRVEFQDPSNSQNVIVYYQNNSIIFYSISQGINNFMFQLKSTFTLNANSILDRDKFKLFGLVVAKIYIETYSCASGFFRIRPTWRCYQCPCDPLMQNCALAPTSCTINYNNNSNSTSLNNTNSSNTFFNSNNLNNSNSSDSLNSSNNQINSNSSNISFNSNNSNSYNSQNSSNNSNNLNSANNSNSSNNSNSTNNRPSNGSILNNGSYDVQSFYNTYSMSNILKQLDSLISKSISSYEKIYRDIFGHQFFEQIKARTIQIIQFACIVNRIAPLAFVFIGFVNYWYLCSYYALVQNIIKPKLLTDLLDIIFQSTNVSLLELLNINIGVDSGLDNQFDGTFYWKYSIISDFVQTHTQDILMFTCSLSTLGILVFIKSLLNPKSWIAKQLNFNTAFFIFGQLVAILPSYLFPFDIIFSHMNFLSFGYKINLLLHLIFICIMMFVPFLILIYYQKTKYRITQSIETYNQQKKIKKHKNQNNLQKQQEKQQARNTNRKYQKKQLSQKQNQHLRNVKQKSNQQTINKEQLNKTKYQQEIQEKKQQNNDHLKMVYYSLCGFFLPFTIIIDIKQIIFIAGIMLFSLGIHQARSQVKYRTNKIVLACHILVFHLGFFLMILLADYKSLSNIIGIFSGIVLLIGATHETINILYELLYYLYTYLVEKCQKMNKVGNLMMNQQKKQQIQRKNMKQAFKRRQKRQFKKGLVFKKDLFNRKLKLKDLQSALKQFQTNRQQQYNQQLGQLNNKVYFNQENMFGRNKFVGKRFINQNNQYQTQINNIYKSKFHQFNTNGDIEFKSINIETQSVKVKREVFEDFMKHQDLQRNGYQQKQILKISRFANTKKIGQKRRQNRLNVRIMKQNLPNNMPF